MKSYAFVGLMFLAIAGCSVASIAPFIAPVGGNAACTALSDKDRVVAQPIIAELAAATPEQRRAMIENPNGDLAKKLPAEFGKWWALLHDIFRKSTPANVQAAYDKAVDGFIRGCAKSFGASAA